jgi:hypothetical protein
MPQDLSQSPADVFAGLQDPVGPFSEPGALSYDPFAFGGVDAGGSAEFPGGGNPWDGSGVDASAKAEFPSQQVDPNGTQTAGSGGSYNPTGGVPFGSAPAGGVFQAGTYIPTGGYLGTNYGNMGIHYVGVPGTYIPASDTLGTGYSTHLGMSMSPTGGTGVGSWSLTGAGYGDQFSRASSGWDQGFGDPSAFSDFITYKHGGLGPTQLDKVPKATPAQDAARNTGLNWGGNMGGHPGRG